MKIDIGIFIIAFLFCALSGNIFSQELPFNLLSLDHVVIAVSDLDSAVSFFNKLGFTIKPGRLHDNSIKNAHIKFQNNTSLELLTASARSDQISARYVDRITKFPKGSGAYLSLRLDSENSWRRVIAHFDSSNVRYFINDFKFAKSISFETTESLNHIFLIYYTQNYNEEKKYTSHANSATGISAVEIKDYSPLKDDSEIILKNGKILLNKTDKINRLTKIMISISDIHDLTEQIKSNFPNDFNLFYQNNKVIIQPDLAFGITFEFYENRKKVE